MTKESIILLPPTIKAVSGETFEVIPTEKTGVFATWSGDTLNFGYGMTSYIGYTYSKDGEKVYYSDSRTGFKITIPSPGEYRLYVAGEKDHVAHNGKEIPGFTPSLLTLPEGKNAWSDDGCGTMTAVFDENVEIQPEKPPFVAPESLRKLPAEKQEELSAPAEYVKGSADSSEKEYREGAVSYRSVYGTRVRDIRIPAATSGKKKTVIAALADMHMNHVTEDDRDDAEVQYTNKTRHWGRGGSLTPRAVRGLAFADMYDQIVIAGDILDYLSAGAAREVRESIIKPYPDVMMTIGGHDITKNMETGFHDKLSIDERRAYLAAFWPHDLFYYSKIVNDSVMCITMDNGVGKYHSTAQLAGLKADIEKARENGYTVLIFQHEPIAARDEKYAATPCMDECADPVKMTFNYYGPLHIGGVDRNDDELTRETYDLIMSSADVIKGVIAGHRHYNYYIELAASLPDGTPAVIPQYVIRASAYDEFGNVAKITVE